MSGARVGPSAAGGGAAGVDAAGAEAAAGGSAGVGAGGDAGVAAGAEAGARGHASAGAGVEADDGAAEAEAGGGAGGALGGLPLFGRVAAGVSSATAAGWQFSQWCRSMMSVPLACWPVMTSRTDLPTRRNIGKGPCLIVSKGCPILDLPLLTYT